jgi:hypothetical protein
MQSDDDDEPEEAEDLASSADLSFDEIRSVLNKPEKQVRLHTAGIDRGSRVSPVGEGGAGEGRKETRTRAQACCRV